MEKELGGKAGVHLCKLRVPLGGQQACAHAREKSAVDCRTLAPGTAPLRLEPLCPRPQVRWSPSAAAEAGIPTPAWLPSGKGSTCQPLQEVVM